MEGLDMTTLKLLHFHLLCIIPLMSAAPRLLDHSTHHVTNESFGFRVNLWRRDTHTSFTERFHAAVERSKQRAQHVAAVIDSAASALEAESLIQTPVVHGQGEFLMDVGVGTPTVNFKAIVDTGSDLIWTQCLPCLHCFNQTTPIFDPSKSSTYSTIPCGHSLCSALGRFRTGCDPACSFTYSYGDSSSTSGELAYDTLTFGSGMDVSVPHLGFGCAHGIQGKGFEGGGIVGLGRGALSLVTQLGSKVENKFSYCLVPITDPPSNSSPLIFGVDAAITGGQTVTLIPNSQYPSFWYIPITGLTVGGKSVDIRSGTFDISSDGNGGMIIDSGTTVTMLAEEAYNPLCDAIKSALSLPIVDGSSWLLDLCFEASDSTSGELPSMTFNFGTVNFEIPPENVFMKVDQQTFCLAMLPGNGMSVLGNIQQQNIQFVYDNAQNTLSFKSAKCDSL